MKSHKKQKKQKMEDFKSFEKYETPKKQVTTSATTNKNRLFALYEPPLPYNCLCWNLSKVIYVSSPLNELTKLVG